MILGVSKVDIPGEIPYLRGGVAKISGGRGANKYLGEGGVYHTSCRAPLAMRAMKSRKRRPESPRVAVRSRKIGFTHHLHREIH